MKENTLYFFKSGEVYEFHKITEDNVLERVMRLPSNIDVKVIKMLRTLLTDEGVSEVVIADYAIPKYIVTFLYCVMKADNVAHKLISAVDEAVPVFGNICYKQGIYKLILADLIREPIMYRKPLNAQIRTLITLHEIGYCKNLYTADELRLFGDYGDILRLSDIVRNIAHTADDFKLQTQLFALRDILHHIMDNMVAQVQSYNFESRIARKVNSKFSAVTDVNSNDTISVIKYRGITNVIKFTEAQIRFMNSLFIDSKMLSVLLTTLKQGLLVSDALVSEALVELFMLAGIDITTNTNLLYNESKKLARNLPTLNNKSVNLRSSNGICSIVGSGRELRIVPLTTYKPSVWDTCITDAPLGNIYFANFEKDLASLSKVDCNTVDRLLMSNVCEVAKKLYQTNIVEYYALLCELYSGNRAELYLQYIDDTEKCKLSNKFKD